MEVHSLIRDYKSLFIYTHLLWHCHIAAAVDPVCCGVYLTLPSSFHMEWCIKNDKIEILTMKYTWNGMECSWNVHGMCMECAWNVHGVFHMESMDSIPYSIASMDSMDSIWNGVQTIIR